MADLHFTSSPLHQASKAVLVDSERQLFGNTQLYLQFTVGGLLGGGMEGVNIASLRGRLGILHVLHTLWRSIETNNRKNPDSYYWNHYVKDRIMSLCWSDMLIALAPATRDELQQHVSQWVSNLTAKKQSDAPWDQVLQGDFWAVPLNYTGSEALLRERLWDQVGDTLPISLMRALLQDSMHTTQTLYREALKRGGEDTLAHNLSLLAQIHPTTPQELAGAIELLSTALALGNMNTPDSLAGLIDQAAQGGWEVFFSEWESTAGLTQGTFARLVGPDGWLSQLGLVRPSDTIKHWVMQRNGPVLKEDIAPLLKAQPDAVALVTELMGGSYRPFTGHTPGIGAFGHLGMDQKNLVSFAKSTKPLRLLLVGDNGTGKTALVLALAKLRGKGAVSASEGADQAKLVRNLTVLQHQSHLLDHPLIAVDSMDALLGREHNHIEQYLMDSQARRSMTTSEAWTICKLKDVPTTVLAGFDLIVHLRSMPLAEREQLALAHFPPELAKRVAQMSANAGDILGAAQWARTSGVQEWGVLAARLNGLQEAVSKTREANDSLPLQSYKPGALQLGFDSVAGQEEAVERAKRLIGSLRDPQRFKRLNATSPKGVLLTGGPGMGKTHLARAMAVEAGVPFLLADCAAMARNATLIGAVFAEARRMAPCILFLDELDAIGTTAKGIMGASPDPARQGILNRLLMELDGVEALDGVLVVGATHRAELLDGALVRSGRLGWRVALRSPDTRARKALWLHYAKQSMCADTISWERVARISSGMTPADISQAFNAAAMAAVEHDAERVGIEHLVHAIDETLWKSSVVDMYLLEDERWRTAVHEAGHALMAWHAGREIERASIRPRSRAVGHVRMLDEDGRISQSPGDVMASMATCFGGLCAEEVVFGAPSDGAASDLEKVRYMVQKAVRQDGMNAAFPAGVDQGVSHAFLREVEKAEQEMMGTLRTSTREWLTEHRPALEAFARILLEQREMDGTEIEAALSKLLADQRGSRVAIAALAAKGFSS